MYTITMLTKGTHLLQLVRMNSSWTRYWRNLPKTVYYWLRQCMYTSHILNTSVNHAMKHLNTSYGSIKVLHLYIYPKHHVKYLCLFEFLQHFKSQFEYIGIGLNPFPYIQYPSTSLILFVTLLASKNTEKNWGFFSVIWLEANLGLPKFASNCNWIHHTLKI